MTEPAVPTKASATRVIRLEQIYPVLEETLSGGGSFILTVTGMSMFPTLLGGRDRVTLKKAPAPLSKYDLPLYRRRDGSFVLHRILRLEKDGTYTCCGDHQHSKETGLLQEQMIGIVTEIERKGKRFPVTKLRYRLWVRFWVDFYFLRPIGLTILRKVQQKKQRSAQKNAETEG